MTAATGLHHALDVDVRDTVLAAREQVVEAVIAATREIAERRGLDLGVTPIVQDVPVALDASVIDAAAAAAAHELALLSRRMTSGAHHDAMAMGSQLPIGMIFVPSAGGISHHAAEYTDPADLEHGVRALATLAA